MLDDFVLIAQSAPRLDGWAFFLIFMRLVHILSSIVLLGGIFYLLAVVAPKAVTSGGSADAWFDGNRAAWAKWVGITTALLLVSGLFNFVNNVTTYKLVPSYHMLGTMKILLGLVVFFLAAIMAGKTPLADSFRQSMPKWLKVAMFVGILVVLIGGVMKTYPREPKPVEGPAILAPAN
jgi:uncharacterized membrane protein